jgi:uncharacterized coiled-coil DUF342 family protein
MAILKCSHCDFSKEVSEQYVDKTVKCPSCGQAAQVYNTIALMSAFSETMLEFKTELEELKQKIANQELSVAQHDDDDTVEAFGRIFREHRIAMTEFSEATKRRDVITSRTDQRSLYLMRFGIAGFLIMMLLMSFFIYQFTESTKLVYEQSIKTNGRVKNVNDELNTVKDNLAKLAMNTQSHQEMTNSVGEIQTAVGTVQGKVKELNGSVVQMREQLKDLSMKNEMILRYFPYR